MVCLVIRALLMRQRTHCSHHWPAPLESSAVDLVTIELFFNSWKGIAGALKGMRVFFFFCTSTGDGSVPYASLNYCSRWKNNLDLRIEELQGVEHREILSKSKKFTPKHREKHTRCECMVLSSFHSPLPSLLCCLARQQVVLQVIDRTCL